MQHVFLESELWKSSQRDGASICARHLRRFEAGAIVLDRGIMMSYLTDRSTDLYGPHLARTLVIISMYKYVKCASGRGKCPPLCLKSFARLLTFPNRSKAFPMTVAFVAQ